MNIDDTIRKDIYERANDYLDKWFSELGIEGTLELVERNSEMAVYRIYKELLENRGLKLLK